MYDVFINHSGIDTNQNFAGLLYDKLTSMWIRTFIDKMSMKLGDKLLDEINKAFLDVRLELLFFLRDIVNHFLVFMSLLL